MRFAQELVRLDPATWEEKVAQFKCSPPFLARLLRDNPDFRVHSDGTMMEHKNIAYVTEQGIKAHMEFKDRMYELLNITCKTQVLSSDEVRVGPPTKKNNNKIKLQEYRNAFGNL